MPDEDDKPGGESRLEGDGSSTSAGGERDPSKSESSVPAPRGTDSERPTVSPPFDPAAFARDALRATPKPMPAVSGQPASRPTGPHRSEGPQRKKTPTSTLSLLNARIPSNLPPRTSSIARPERGQPSRAAPPPPSAPAGSDDQWADMELATRPPPADGPGEDPVIEIERTPPIDLDDLELGLTAEAPPLGVPPLPSFKVEEDLDDDEHSADTVRRPLPHEKPPTVEMSDRVSLGDYSGALEIAERILRANPEDRAARACAESCRVVLRQMYATRIGPLDRVPVVMVSRDQLRWLSIDHKAGFVLSLVDGVSSLEMIIDVSGMPELDTLRILSELAQQRIISLR